VTYPRLFPTYPTLIHPIAGELKVHRLFQMATYEGGDGLPNSQINTWKIRGFIRQSRIVLQNRQSTDDDELQHWVEFLSPQGLPDPRTGMPWIIPPVATRPDPPVRRQEDAELLPPVCGMACLESTWITGKEPDAYGSTVDVIWFHHEWALPIPADIQMAVKEIPWPKLARDLVF